MSEFFDSDGEVKKGRHQLPHWHQDHTWIFITWRLADSLPKVKIDQWRELKDAFYNHHTEPWDEKTHIAYRKLITDDIEAWLDRGHGGCLLRQPEARKIVESAFLHFHTERYDLRSFVIMPNHVHLLLRPITPYLLSEIVHSLKSFTANRVNQVTGKRGQLWQTEYHDRLIRSSRHFDWANRYIQENPVKLPAADFTLWQAD